MAIRMRVLLVLALLTVFAVGCTQAATTVAPEKTEAPAAEKTEAPMQETEAPATEAPAAAEPATFDRSETLYVSGSAWGPASTWNPFQPGSLANTTGTIGFVYEFLYSFDPMTGVLSPWLAESGQWTDDTTYEVTLRDGLTWSDGEPLTAADVKYTFELGQQHSALWFAPLWNYLTGVEAVDDTHVTFTFDDPLYQEWDNYLYNLPIVPEHLWADKSEEDITTGANEKPVGQ